MSERMTPTPPRLLLLLGGGLLTASSLLACGDGAATPECSSDDDCLTGAVCESGACVPEADTGGGTDGGDADAGDAGGADAQDADAADVEGPDADADADAGPVDTGVDADGGSDADSGADADSGSDAGADADATDAEDVCGDRIRGITEGCDDGNTDADDGCSADCAIESGYRCPTVGELCEAIVCGDGRIETPETCDDGNGTSGDGCSEACELEEGWRCPFADAPCRAARCGDSRVVDDEECDDGNGDDDDGCSSSCVIESGFVCAAGGPCSATTCGDGVVEGTESCDDGNTEIGDGCTPACELEPDCAGGTCEATCGDGRIFGDEACDDGNVRDGDGCSSTCEVEDGFACTDVDADAAGRALPVVYRDLRASHPDTQRGGSAETGMVEDTLDADGLPVPVVTSANLTTAANFRDWYVDTAENQTVASTLVLPTQPDGSWSFASDSFFPLDGQGWSALGEPSAFDCTGTPHNFHFTTETRFWAEYDPTAPISIQFRGDDDAWVFVNGRLAIDLGGVHPPLAGGLTLDPSTEESFGFAEGDILEVAVFHAERQTCASNFALILNGGGAVRSSCEGTCGDGVVTRGEVCDDGENTGLYGSCTADCLAFGPRCGDGVVQDELEACDDGADAGLYEGCNPDCTLGPRCGDGIRQPEHEACDAGDENGGPLCTEECTLPEG